MIVARKSSKLKSEELLGGCAIIGIISLERKNYVQILELFPLKEKIM